MRYGVRIVYSPRYHIDIGTHVFPTRSTSCWLNACGPRPGCGVRRTGACLLGRTRPGAHPGVPRQDQDWRIRARGARPARGAVVAGSRRRVPAHDGRDHTGRGAGRQGGAFRAVCHIGGGFHHAFANHGEGFCLFNDVAVAIRVLSAPGARSRGLRSSTSTCITGTAPRSSSRTILGCSRSPCTSSTTTRRSSRADRSTLGCPTPRATACISNGWFPRLTPCSPTRRRWCSTWRARIHIDDDQLGGLSLSKAGLRERDRTVFRACAIRKIPVAVVLAGGYARKVEDTIDIHAATIDEALT